MSKKVLICGDSFGTTDEERYPGLHFSEKIKEKISDCEIINLARGGASNSLIEMQVHQGLIFEPDYAIVLFTNSHRFEYPKAISNFFQQSINYFPKHVPWDDVLKFNDSTYLTSAHWNWIRNEIPKYDRAHGMIESSKQKFLFESADLTIIKNYFTMLSVLNLFKINNIPVCFTLGGMDNNSDSDTYTDYHGLKNRILKEHYLPNELEEYMSQSININLWDYANHTPAGPTFHVEDDAIQTQFADECITKLGLL